MIDRFNIRVYGIWLDEDWGVLTTQETVNGQKVVKFPGGGLEFGEGTIDCLKRELLEELNCEVVVEDHFYTTDYFQPSAFDSRDQLISVYYLISGDISQFSNREKNGLSDELVFAWLPLEQLSPSAFTFPIDQQVSEKLLKKLKR